MKSITLNIYLRAKHSNAADVDSYMGISCRPMDSIRISNLMMYCRVYFLSNQKLYNLHISSQQWFAWI